MIRAVHASSRRSVGVLSRLARALRGGVRRRAGPPDDDAARDALIRALCHDMRGPLSSLHCALGHLDDGGPARADLLSLARAQTDQLSSMLRTVEASDGGTPRRSPWRRPLPEVVAAAVAAAGLPRAQLTVQIGPGTAEVTVGDARLQRILWNLLENAHRHGEGAPVTLDVTCDRGWVQLSVTQSGVPSTRVVDHLCASSPPTGLTGLGLWSVRRQTAELGGRVLWDDDGAALTLRIVLPDR